MRAVDLAQRQGIIVVKYRSRQRLTAQLAPQEDKEIKLIFMQLQALKSTCGP